ncbi:MAG: 4Fe-4S binding protein, partial [Deltaproteobacteria bacterium]|nr:4Fe-4S binding protein [Deltaproteobacteria bacterium]
MPFPRITPKRRLVQALLIAAALLLPFASLNGNPFLRMDISLLTLYLAGVPVRVDQFYLLLLATLFVIIVFLLLTVVLGRVWCGWLCPQTVFNDLAELIGRPFQKRVSPVFSKLVEHLIALIISKLIAFNLLCWFMPPGLLFSNLRKIPPHPLILCCFLSLTLFGYLNLILVKRSFCRSYCPYGRLQTALMDSGTLNLAFLEETAERCLNCSSCVRCCPMGIDVRDGFQIECIGCGRCIDACRSVMENRPDGAGLIDYRFGKTKASGVRFGSKTITLSLLTLLIGIAFFWGMIARNQDAFAVQRVASVESLLTPDGFQVQSWRATIGNRSELKKSYRISISPAGQVEASLLGPVDEILIPANQHRE